MILVVLPTAAGTSVKLAKAVKEARLAGAAARVRLSRLPQRRKQVTSAIRVQTTTVAATGASPLRVGSVTAAEQTAVNAHMVRHPLKRRLQNHHTVTPFLTLIVTADVIRTPAEAVVRQTAPSLKPRPVVQAQRVQKELEASHVALVEPGDALEQIKCAQCLAR